MPDPLRANQPNQSAPRDTGRKATTVTVRAARPTDATRLGEINVEAWRVAYDQIVPAAYLATLDVGEARARWRQRIIDQPGDRCCLVAELDGVVASYAVGGAYRVQQVAAPEDTTGWGELFAIYTAPDLQGRGAGRAVHDAVLGGLAQRGCVVVALWVLRDNVRAIGWYGDRGWHRDGATSRWLSAGEPLAEVRLVRRLGP